MLSTSCVSTAWYWDEVVERESSRTGTTTFYAETSFIKAKPPWNASLTWQMRVSASMSYSDDDGLHE